VEIVVALVIALIMALAKRAAMRRPESPRATFLKVRLRTDYATDMHARCQSCDMRAFRGVSKDAQSFGDR
jgi:hypothetical protein